MVHRRQTAAKLADDRHADRRIVGAEPHQAVLLDPHLHFGADEAEPLLGVTALESVGIEVDPANQRLKRLPAVRLK